MKAKPVIIIVVTLIIGFVLGMLVSAQIRYNRLKPVRVFFSEQRFREGFFNMIQPDEKQKETISKILDKYAKTNSTLQGEFRKKLEINMKDFWKELEPVLTKDQLERLREMEKRRNEMIRSHRNPNDSLNFGERHHMPPPPDQQHPPFFGGDTARSK